jgi:hypothetical protein
MAMAKTQSEDMRARRDETQLTMLFDPSRGIEPLLQAGNKWLENWAAMSSEILEFGRTRLDRSFEASQALARSASLDEAVDLQVTYTRATLRDYFAEASKLADLGTRAMLDSLRPWQPAARGEAPMAMRSEAMQRRDAA